jgi:hypothetical protein
VNDYAALPSFHFGWILLATLAIWANTDRRWVKALAVSLSVVMFWAITVTGNHYFFDMAFGAAVVLVSWLVVDAVTTRRSYQRSDAPSDDPAAAAPRTQPNA